MGRPDYKHRDASYQHICAQILRETTDLNTLAAAATRALSHPEVCHDPILAAMVRSFVAEQEAAIRVRRRVEHADEVEDKSQLRKAFEVGGEFPARHQLLATFAKHQHDFEIHLAEYNEAAARYALEKMQDLARRFPVHIDQEAVKRHVQQFADMLQRCELYRKQIEQVAKQAAAAARQGDENTASWLIRRLRAIHALTPVLLSKERFEALRDEIEKSGQVHEHREALHELMARERAVAAEIKKVGAAIYRFHKIARALPPESDEYQRAEAAYKAAVEQVRQRDTEWLTGLLLELETYLEDLHDATGKAQEQLDRFIATVRTALNQLRLEIRAIQEERAGGVKSSATSKPAVTRRVPSTGDGAQALRTAGQPAAPGAPPAAPPNGAAAGAPPP